MRLFIGIPLPADVNDALERLVGGLRSQGDGLRWSSPESRHITLQFLGNTSIEDYRCIVQHLTTIEASAVPVWLHGTGSFDRAGVFSAGVSVSPELHQLERLVLEATAHCGISAEDRPYHPHITLARAKGDNRARPLRNIKHQLKSDMEFPQFTAREFLLFESFLNPAGARHEIRDRFPLG